MGCTAAAQRTLSVVADTYCEIASIEPRSITSKVAWKKLHSYAEMRQELEAKMNSDGGGDIEDMLLEVQTRFAEEAAAALEEEEEELEEPPPPAPTAEGSEGVVELLMDLKRGQMMAQAKAESQLQRMDEKIAGMAAQLSALAAK